MAQLLGKLGIDTEMGEANSLVGKDCLPFNSRSEAGGGCAAAATAVCCEQSFPVRSFEPLSLFLL
jgi:hypothetical protein